MIETRSGSRSCLFTAAPHVTDTCMCTSIEHTTKTAKRHTRTDIITWTQYTRQDGMVCSHSPLAYSIPALCLDGHVCKHQPGPEQRQQRHAGQRAPSNETDPGAHLRQKDSQGVVAIWKRLLAAF